MPETAAIHRLFFALWPDDATRKSLYRAGIATGHHSVPTPRDNLHMTLVFLGKVDDATLDCARKVAEHIEFPPFALSIDRIGHFGRRILWLGSAEPPEALFDLQRRLQRGLAQRCNYPPEKRGYHPHITVARKQVPPLMEPLSTPVHWQVESFSLIRSDTTQTPPVYREIARWQA